MSTTAATNVHPPQAPAPGQGEAPSAEARPQRRRRAVAWAALAAVAAIAVLFVGPWIAKREPAPAPAREVPVVEGDRIRFSPEFARRAGIASAPVEPREVAPLVVVPGTVELDPRRVAAVGARIPGRVKTVRRFEGDEVRAGDVLAEIESAELGRAQSELLKARAREEATAADRAREERLAEARISALRDAQAARAAAVAAHAERLAAEQAVRALGGDVDPQGDIGVMRLRAPISGRVLASKLHRGKPLEATETPFLVADLGRVWIKLDIFERDLAAVRVGDPVEVARQAEPSRVAIGQVARTGDVVNAQTHSAEVWVEVENPSRWLRPGESVRARIRGSGGRTSWPTVPLEAVVTVDGRPTVFVAQGDDAVQIRPITPGPSGEKHAAVAAGLEPGERVVVQGAFALKSEIFR